MIDRSTDLHILSNAELFRGLATEALDEVRANAARRKLVKGEALFRQHEPASGIHVVIAGRLRIVQTTESGQQIIIRYLGAGEVAGYAVLSHDPEHTATATAVDDTAVIGWPRAAFRELVARHPAIAFNALAAMETRYRDMQTRVRELATETVEQRIAHTVLRLAHQAGRRTPAGLEIAIPLTRQDIAEMAGTTLHTVSRTISSWEELGIVDSGRRRVVVRNPAELTMLAGAR